MQTGYVFDIQRFSLHDGPGIRTTVFLKGCPLHCRWCHNPEGIDPRPQLRVLHSVCTRCGCCLPACPQGCHALEGEERRFNAEHCTRCGRCIEACPMRALEMVGKLMTSEEVIAVVRRDIPFYQQSGGGMTLSGGEPMAQPRFTHELLRLARTEGISTALETSACAPWPVLEEILDEVDLFLVDLKHTDSAHHRQLTGMPNEEILSNIRRLIVSGQPLTLRIPWVPTENADPTFLDNLLAFLGELPTPPPLQFMLFHRLGIGKWHDLGGISPISKDIPAATEEDVAPWASRLRAAGYEVKVG